MTYYKKLYEKTRPYIYVMKNQWQEVIQHVRTVTGNVPTHRRASKHSYSFSNSPLEQQLVIWDQVWRNSGDFWVRVHAFFFLERNMNKHGALQVMWPVIVKWQDQVDDWPLCDALAKIYTKVLVVVPAKVYAQLKKWNRRRSSRSYGNAGSRLFHCYITAAQKRLTSRLVKLKNL